MDEQQIRALVRQAIARHHGVGPERVADCVHRDAAPALSPQIAHVSVARFHLERPVTETDCLIEPAVTCNHCGHCQCFGH